MTVYENMAFPTSASGSGAASTRALCVFGSTTEQLVASPRDEAVADVPRLLVTT